MSDEVREAILAIAGAMKLQNEAISALSRRLESTAKAVELIAEIMEDEGTLLTKFRPKIPFPD